MPLTGQTDSRGAGKNKLSRQKDLEDIQRSDFVYLSWSSPFANSSNTPWNPSYTCKPGASSIFAGWPSWNAAGNLFHPDDGAW